MPLPRGHTSPVESCEKCKASVAAAEARGEGKSSDQR